MAKCKALMGSPVKGLISVGLICFEYVTTLLVDIGISLVMLLAKSHYDVIFVLYRCVCISVNIPFYSAITKTLLFTILYIRSYFSAHRVYHSCVDDRTVKSLSACNLLGADKTATETRGGEFI